MSCWQAFFRTLSFLAFSANVGWAADPGWNGRLVQQFSSRWGAIQKELAELKPKLEALPSIPIDDQGGTGGYAGNHPQATATPEAPIAVEIHWQEEAEVDFVALIPARRYDAKGLDPQYGMPLAFRVDLIAKDGAVVCQVGSEASTKANPVRMGHPFVFRLATPVSASGLRISAQTLNSEYENEGVSVHVWAEAMAFSGIRNVAAGAEVRSVGGATPSTPWHWSPAFLVDGQTPLGLPEIPTQQTGDIGWMSEPRANASEATHLSVDLGERVAVDSIRLLPAKRPTSDLPSGFGFPRKISISSSETGEPGSWTVVATQELRNPGNNPMVISFPTTSARHFKVEATELWKAFDEFPAFFALSELEILSQEKNLARGKGIRSPDGMMNLISPGGRFWSTAALSDGFGPDGKLVPTREWMERLDERLQLETRRHHLQIESAQLIDHWRHSSQWVLAILALGGVCLIVVLPIRYRLHANRELVKVRERIAGDLHDEVGSNLGSIQMIADLAEGRSGPSDELKRIQRIAAETVSAVRDIVWLLRPTGDHRIGTVEHLRETSSIMLESLDWKFSADEKTWQVEFPEESNRDLFLYFREALHNIMRHARASKVEIRAETVHSVFRLSIADNGSGIDPAKMERPSTLRALRQRAAALRADLQVESTAETGTCLILSVPLGGRPKS
jgi:signal transduction histidine kinase